MDTTMRRLGRTLGLLFVLSVGACAAAAGTRATLIEIQDASHALYRSEFDILTPADEATATVAGSVRVHLYTPAWIPPDQEGEPDATMIIVTEIGGAYELNASHAAGHLDAQRPGGRLAQVMNLASDAAPRLFQHQGDRIRTSLAVCPPHGPSLVGYHRAPDGVVTIVGFGEAGVTADNVCARLVFRSAP